MTHKVVAIKCNYARGELSLTSIGESPRGTKFLLRKITVPNYDPKDKRERIKVKEAVDRLLYPDSE